MAQHSGHFGKRALRRSYLSFCAITKSTNNYCGDLNFELV